jgi:hypothetical protein
MNDQVNKSTYHLEGIFYFKSWLDIDSIDLPDELNWTNNIIFFLKPASTLTDRFKINIAHPTVLLTFFNRMS